MLRSFSIPVIFDERSDQGNAWGTNDGCAKRSFRDAIALRKARGFNGITLIVCFPCDTEKGSLDKARQGEKDAEGGSVLFKINGGVDYTRFNSSYLQHADRKANGSGRFSVSDVPGAENATGPFASKDSVTNDPVRSSKETQQGNTI